MPTIFDRALSPQAMLRGQSVGLLGMGQPARLPGRPPIPQVGVGNVDFIGARGAEQQLGVQQQQQVLGSLLQLGQTGAAIGGAAYMNRPQFSRPGSKNFGGSSNFTGTGYDTSPIFQYSDYFTTPYAPRY